MDFRSKSARMVFVLRSRVYFSTFALCNWPVECQNRNYSHCLWPSCTNLNICFYASTFCLSSEMDVIITLSIPPLFMCPYSWPLALYFLSNFTLSFSLVPFYLLTHSHRFCLIGWGEGKGNCFNCLIVLVSFLQLYKWNF